MSDCYYDAAGCLVCPEVHGSAYVPARVKQLAIIGWNAGANSISTVDGPLHAVFSMAKNVSAVVMGLKGDRARQTVPDLVEHGWYFLSKAGVSVAQVIERSKTKTLPQTYSASDTFEVRRLFGGQVTYWKNGQKVYTSLTRSTGAKVLNACLYASGDHIGEAA